MIKNLYLLILVCNLGLVANSWAQDEKDTNDLEDMLSDAVTTPKTYTMGTFKTTRIANGHSVENVGKGVLDFRVNHRFGRINDGISEFFGLDNAVTRIGFDYGITNWLMVGYGRSTLNKEYDGYLKAKLLKQTDDNAMPVSLSYVGAISVEANKVQVPAGQEYYFSNRIAYVNQLLIARKFNSAFSLQLMPTHLHYNYVTYNDEPNDIFALGIGTRVKLSKRISLTGEYYYQFNQLRDTYNSLTLGIDIETGGHVFQLFFSNSAGITERSVIGKTTGNWLDGDIHFGFNISRVFTIVRPKEFRNSRNQIW